MRLARMAPLKACEDIPNFSLSSGPDISRLAAMSFSRCTVSWRTRSAIKSAVDILTPLLDAEHLGGAFFSAVFAVLFVGFPATMAHSRLSLSIFNCTGRIQSNACVSGYRTLSAS